MVRPPEEIVLVLNIHVAQVAGFRPNGQHRQYEHLTAWWPGRGLSGIMMKRWPRVTIDSSLTHARAQQERREISEAVTQLRKGGQVFGDAFVWLEF